MHAKDQYFPEAPRSHFEYWDSLYHRAGKRINKLSLEKLFTRNINSSAHILLFQTNIYYAGSKYI